MLLGGIHNHLCFVGCDFLVVAMDCAEVRDFNIVDSTLFVELGHSLGFVLKGDAQSLAVFNNVSRLMDWTNLGFNVLNEGVFR